MVSGFNKKGLKGLRQNLRNNMPPAERILWSKLKGKQLEKYKFRRQHSMMSLSWIFIALRQGLQLK